MLLKCFCYSDNGIVATLSFQRILEHLWKHSQDKWFAQSSPVSVCVPRTMTEVKMKLRLSTQTQASGCECHSGIWKVEEAWGSRVFPSSNYCITEWEFCSLRGLTENLSNRQGNSQAEVRDDRRQLDKGAWGILELLPNLWRTASKTNRASRANTASELLCVPYCPHNDINQDNQMEKPASFCSWKWLSKSILSYNRTQTGDEGEHYAIVWGLQKQRVMNNTNETWNNALGPRSEGCYGEWNHHWWSR